MQNLSLTATPDKVKKKPGRKPLNLVPSTEFGKTMTVVLPDKSRIEIPIDEIAAKEQCKVLTAKARQFFEAQLDKLSVATLTPKEVADMISAAHRLDELMRTQYAADLNASLGSPASTAMGRAVGQMIASAAQGAAMGTASGFNEKLAEMEKAAKKVEPATIEIKPA